MRSDDIQLEGCDMKKIPCRFCKHADPNSHASGSCQRYKVKPYDVYFKNDKCDGFEKGEDLLPMNLIYRLIKNK